MPLAQETEVEVEKLKEVKVSSSARKIKISVSSTAGTIEFREADNVALMLQYSMFPSSCAWLAKVSPALLPLASTARKQASFPHFHFHSHIYLIDEQSRVRRTNDFDDRRKSVRRELKK